MQYHNMLGYGYKLFVDNGHTTQPFFEYLLDNKTIAISAARAKCLNIPKPFMGKKLEKGEHYFHRNGNLLADKFQDKKEVSCIQLYTQ